MDEIDVLIAGAGLAGSRCAETLRADGFGGRIVVAGDEPHAPYERPALSKELLTGRRTAADLTLRPPGFWDGRDIELRLGEALGGLDLGARARARRRRAAALAAPRAGHRGPGAPAPDGLPAARTSTTCATLDDARGAARPTSRGAAAWS